MFAAVVLGHLRSVALDAWVILVLPRLWLLLWFLPQILIALQPGPR